MLKIRRLPVEGIQRFIARMTLTSQVFPVMSGTATREQVEQITRAADRLLYQPGTGGYKLNTDFGGSFIQFAIPCSVSATCFKETCCRPPVSSCRQET